MAVVRLFSRKNYPLILSTRNASELKNLIAGKVLKEQEKVKQFRKTHGSKVVGQITVNQIYGGMRGMLGLICDTSTLDPNEGIRFRGKTIPECRNLLPKAKGGTEPLPEGMFWLLLTGDVPTDAQVTALSAELCNRAVLPSYVDSMIKSFPSTMLPMTQFTAAMTALNSESKFDKGYREGLKKDKFWEYAYEDALTIVAQIPVIAAKVYRNTYKDGKGNTVIDSKKDWSANLAQMMGMDNPLFIEFLRLYLTCHSDHESGNVSAHTCHLVSSALSDPYLSYAAGMNGLAGPIHGQANVEVLRFINGIVKELGEKPTNEQIKTYCENTLKKGLVIPGFGHAVLRVTDPRYVSQSEFAKKHFPNDAMFKITQQIFEIAPGILKATGKVQNPWPNVDANSGVCLQALGLKDIHFYLVLFGVSRALGVLATLVWSRALGLPIERPKSISTEHLIALVAKNG